MTPWPRDERLRVLEVLGPDLPRKEWARMMGVSAETIRDDYRVLGEDIKDSLVIRELLARLHWTQEALAVWSGFDSATVTNWVRGVNRAPDYVIERLADLAGARLTTSYHVESAA